MRMEATAIASDVPTKPGVFMYCSMACPLLAERGMCRLVDPRATEGFKPINLKLDNNSELYIRSTLCLQAKIV